MKVLLTGGSGFLGINMIRYLLQKRISIVSLDLVDFDYPEKNLIQEIKGDIRNISTVEKAMKGVDIVIHAAAALPRYKKSEIFSTDVDGTRNVITIAQKYNVTRDIPGVRRWEIIFPPILLNNLLTEPASILMLTSLNICSGSI